MEGEEELGVDPAADCGVAKLVRDPVMRITLLSGRLIRLPLCKAVPLALDFMANLAFNRGLAWGRAAPAVVFRERGMAGGALNKSDGASF